MNYKILFALILTLITAYDVFLYMLDYRSAANPLPENVRDIYDAEKNKRRQAYYREKVRANAVGSLAILAVNLTLIQTDAYAWVAGLAPNMPSWRSWAVMLLATAAYFSMRCALAYRSTSCEASFCGI